MLIFISQLPRLLLAAENDTLPPLTSPPPHPDHPYSRSASLRPSITVIIVILTTVFSLTFLLLLYAKHCNRHVTTYAAGGGSLPVTDRRNSGVSRSTVDSLPVFRFSSLTGHKDGLDCAVCLTRFEPSDLLRLLPKCKHGFHVECVDTWLESHSTCPLCRVRVDPEDVLLVLDPNSGLKQSGSPAAAAPPAAVAAPPPSGRRISGRHSYAGGEKRSGGGLTAIAAAGRRLSEGGGGGGGNGAVSVGCFDRVRKDGLLSTMEEEKAAAGPAEREEFERRFGHRINVVSEGSGSLERWSDLQPSDLFYLRSEMIITKSGRITGVRSGSGKDVNSLRSVSEFTGVSRFGEGGERTREKWLGFQEKRAEAAGPGPSSSSRK